jgi:acetolactate synthase I/II/III large subunit
MSKVDGGVLFGRMLKKEGIEKVFTLCGEHIMPMLFGCKEAGIEVIDFRHEGPAINAADAYARITGKPSVILATSGPGVFDCVCGMIECMNFSVPVVLIGGGAPKGASDTGQLQDYDSYSIFKNSSRFARRVLQAERFPYMLSVAFRNAMGPTPGPVYLECDMDTLFPKVIDEDSVVYPENYRTSAVPFGDPELVEQAADMLISAKQPYLIIGNESIYTAQHGEAIEELVNYLQLPTFVETDARGFFANEETNPLFTIFSATEEADVVLTLSTLNDYMVTGLGFPHFDPKAKTIQVNPDITRIGYAKGADIGIVGGAGPVAKQILGAVKRKTAPKTDTTWADKAMAIHKGLMKPWYDAFVEEVEEGIAMNPGRVANETAKFLAEDGKDWTVVCDGGDAAQWIMKAAVARRPHQMISYGALGTIGTGFGYVTGSWAANAKPVLFYIGDGTFGFYATEFYTYVKQGIPVVCVISNDEAWGMIQNCSIICHKDEMEKGGVAFDLPSVVDWEKMPLMWDGYGELVTDPDEIVPAIKRAYASGKPAIVNVRTKSIASPEVQFFGGMMKMGYDFK